MGDSDLEIQIRLLADTHGADETQRALNKVTGSTKEMGHEAELFNVHGHEMRHLFQELNRITPGLGLLLKGLFNPEALGIVGAVLLLERLNEYFKEAAKRAEEFAKAATEGMIKSIEAAREFATAAEEGQAAYRQEVIKTYQELFTAEAQTKRVTEAINAQKEAMLELAKVRGDLDKHQKEITLDAEKLAVQAKKDELTEAEKLQPQLDKAVTDAKEAAEGGLAQSRAHGLAVLKKQVEDAKAEAAKITGTGLEADIKRGAFIGDLPQKLDKIAELEADQKRNAEALAAARAAAEANRKTALQGREALPGLERTLQTHEAAFGLESTQGVSGIVARGAEAIKYAREHGGQVSREQGQAIAGLNAVLSAIGAANQTMIDALVKASGNIVELNKQVQLIKAQQDQIGRNFGN